MFLASKSRANLYRDMVIGGTLVFGGMIVILACIYLILDTDPTGPFLFMGAVGIAIVVIGIDMMVHTRSKMAHEYIMVDFKSARMLEDGNLIMELAFKDKVRVGVTFNFGMNVPELSPLYGIEFEKAGDKIVVSPMEGYALHYVKKLWPLTMTIIRKHDLGITEEFRKNLTYEKEKGGYWAEIHDELLGEMKMKKKSPSKKADVSPEK